MRALADTRFGRCIALVDQGLRVIQLVHALAVQPVLEIEPRLPNQRSQLAQVDALRWRGAASRRPSIRASHIAGNCAWSYSFAAPVALTGLNPSWATDIADSAYQASDDEAEEVVSASAAKLAGLTVKSSGNGGLVLVRSGVQRAWDEMEARFHGEGTLGIAPKWSSVRRKIPGLEPTDLIVLGARPSMGKTAHALNWAEDAAAGGRNVAVFSLEMSASQLSMRLMAAHAGVDLSRMREKGALTDDEWGRLSEARAYLHSLPLAIDDCGSLSVDALAARASRMHAKVAGGLGLIVVDYLQLLTGKAKSENRTAEVSYISRQLKRLAKDLNCPVMALSQLNRGLEGKTDKRPGMADLRESGAIEQDADVIAFLYRDDYYTKDACGAPGISELIVAKNRQGETGTCYLQHRLQCSSFDDYTGPRPNYTVKVAAASAGGQDDFGLPMPRGRRRSSRGMAAGGDE